MRRQAGPLIKTFKGDPWFPPEKVRGWGKGRQGSPHASNTKAVELVTLSKWPRWRAPAVRNHALRLPASIGLSVCACGVGACPVRAARCPLPAAPICPSRHAMYCTATARSMVCTARAPPSGHRCHQHHRERGSPMKNRKREICTSGSGAARLAAIPAGESPANRGVQSLL
jgi:hypothetical protein